jgi:hypothetical protein
VVVVDGAYGTGEANPEEVDECPPAGLNRSDTSESISARVGRGFWMLVLMGVLMTQISMKQAELSDELQTMRQF